jgi:hypothetical protein
VLARANRIVAVSTLMKAKKWRINEREEGRCTQRKNRARRKEKKENVI